jgi:hypothetical protein
MRESNPMYKGKKVEIIRKVISKVFVLKKNGLYTILPNPNQPYVT